MFYSATGSSQSPLDIWVMKPGWIWIETWTLSFLEMPKERIIIRNVFLLLNMESCVIFRQRLDPSAWTVYLHLDFTSHLPVIDMSQRLYKLLNSSNVFVRFCIFEYVRVKDLLELLRFAAIDNTQRLWNVSRLLVTSKLLILRNQLNSSWDSIMFFKNILSIILRFFTTNFYWRYPGIDEYQNSSTYI